MISAVDRECIAVWVEHGIPDIQTAATVPALGGNPALTPADMRAVLNFL